MGGHLLGVAIEVLVAVLLAVTIGYCVLVNQKLVQLRSDQSELKAIVRDLHAATGQAEQAIAGLQQSASTAEESLGKQIELVRSLDGQLGTSISKGEALLTKLAAMPRPQQSRGPSGSNARTQGPAIRQSSIGLGLLNAQRRNAEEKPGTQSGRDGAAA
ncbi:MAG: DUF6468 domain-containing protein [Methyloligellaceae bacterium]